MTDVFSTKDPLHVVTALSLDEPIYRFMKLRYFEEALVNKELVFLNPVLWNDPYELIPQGIYIEDERGNIKGRIQSCLDCCFCLCWSRRGQSDTLLQAYSRVERDAESGNRNKYKELEGVHVRTTPRKLLRVLEASPDCEGREWFIGSVRYAKADSIKSSLVSLLSRDRDSLVSAKGIIDVLLMKREAFEHEGEIRLISVDKRNSGSNTLSIPFNPNDLFESIAFDPRLWTQERHEREASAREAGYTAEIIDSGFYHPTMWVIPEKSLTQE